MVITEEVIAPAPTELLFHMACTNLHRTEETKYFGVTGTHWCAGIG